MYEAQFLIVEVNLSERSEVRWCYLYVRCQNITFFLALCLSKVKCRAKRQSQDTIASYDNRIAINGRIETYPEDSKYIQD
jgi:hypothetical protein